MTSVFNRFTHCVGIKKYWYDYMFTTTDGRSSLGWAVMGFVFTLRNPSLVHGLSRVTLNVPLSIVSLCGTLSYRGQ